MTRKTEQRLTARQIVLAPAVCSAGAGAIAYKTALVMSDGIAGARNLAWLIGLICWACMHALYNNLMYAYKLLEIELETVKHSAPEIREKYIVKVRDEDGNISRTLYQAEMRLRSIPNQELARVCHAVVKAGTYNLRTVKRVSSRAVYERLTSELIRCDYARWKNPNHHQQGVMLTETGREWMRRRARGYSPTGLVKSCDVGVLRLRAHARTGNAREMRLK